jgi:hypothetical protein
MDSCNDSGGVLAQAPGQSVGNASPRGRHGRKATSLALEQTIQ